MDKTGDREGRDNKSDRDIKEEIERGTEMDRNRK